MWRYWFSLIIFLAGFFPLVFVTVLFGYKKMVSAFSLKK